MVEAIGGEAAITPDGYGLLASAMQDRSVGATQVDYELIVKVGFDDAADVILAKDLGIHLARRTPPHTPLGRSTLGPANAELPGSVCAEYRMRASFEIAADAYQ
jgi:hypothetical protein